jgi:hypothetical protein
MLMGFQGLVGYRGLQRCLVTRFATTLVSCHPESGTVTLTASDACGGMGGISYFVLFSFDLLVL